MSLLQTRLTSLDTCGLNAPSFNAAYICHYKGGLIGKHFKSLAQLMPFVVYDIIPEPVLNGWIAIGLLLVLLWHTSIDDIDKYLDDLTKTIDDFLSITAQCAPSIMIQKPKFHFLLHLPMYIRRFGPAITFSTERYESFNHVFRLCSIHSNKKAPSRDTCRWFGTHDIIKHISLGGYWFNSASRKWCRAGNRIMDHIKSDHKHAAYLGLNIPKEKQTYSVRLPPKNNKESPSIVRWSRTRCASHAQGMSRPAKDCRFYQAISVKIENEDDVPLNTAVIVRIENKVRRLIVSLLRFTYNDQLHVAKVCEILALLPQPQAPRLANHVLVQLFALLPNLHARLHVLCLELSERWVVIDPKVRSID